MLVRDITLRDVQLLALHSTLQMVARPIRGDNIASLPATHRGRVSGEGTSDEGAQKLASCATWQ